MSSGSHSPPQVSRTPKHAPEPPLPQGCHCHRSVPPPAPPGSDPALPPGTAEPQQPEQHKGTEARPVCHLSCGGGSGSEEIRAPGSGALSRRYVCWVLSPASRAVTMTRGSARASPAAGFPVSPAPRQQTMSCLTAGDGSALAPLQPRVPGTFRKIKQETGQGKKKVVRARKSKLSFLTWEEDAGVRMFKYFPWEKGIAGHGERAGTRDRLVPHRGAGVTSGGWCHLRGLVPPHSASPGGSHPPPKMHTFCNP